jgi:hypothetical protein
LILRHGCAADEQEHESEAERESDCATLHVEFSLWNR